MSTSGPADPGRHLPPPAAPPLPPLPIPPGPGAGSGAPQPRSPYVTQNGQQFPPPGSEWVDPTWGPPGAAAVTAARRRWLPFLVVALVAGLMAGGFFVADRAGERTLGTAAQGYVPDDGSVQYTVRQFSDGSPEVGYVTESARFSGAEVFTSTDFTFGGALLSAAGLDLDALTGLPFWRTTSTRVGAGVEANEQLVQVFRVDGPVALLGASGPGVAYAYSPALIELPADVRPGSTWSGSGSAGETLDYRSDFRAEAGDRGCLQVSGTIRYSRKDGPPTTTETIRKGWCPHAGATSDQVRTAQQTVTMAAVRGLVSRPAVATTSAPLDWGDPARWTLTRGTDVSIDPNFGPGIMTGSPSAVPPVMTAAGLFVRATSGADLVVFAQRAPSQWAALRRMHPGGTVLSLEAFGDVVVATTSQRQAVGYSVSGVRLWQHDLDEIASSVPVRVDDTRVALADDGGTVRVLDLATGEQQWQRSLRAELQAAPVADARAVVLADGAGRLTALGADDGAELWQRDLEVTRATLVGSTVVTSSAATLTAVSLSDGTSRWLRPLSGTVDALQSFDGRAVLATQLSTSVLAEDGAVQAVFEPAALLTPTADYLVGWGDREGRVVDRDLRVVTTVDTPDRNLTTTGGWPLASRTGPLIFAGDWSNLAWSESS